MLGNHCPIGASKLNLNVLENRLILHMHLKIGMDSRILHCFRKMHLILLFRIANRALIKQLGQG